MKGISTICVLIYTVVLAISLGTARAEVILLDDGFEGSPWNANWDNGSGWQKDTTSAHNGQASAQAHFGNEGNFDCRALDTGDASYILVDFWFRKTGTEPHDYTLYYYNGVVWNFVVELDDLGSDDTWLHYRDNVTDSQYFVSDFRIRLDGTHGHSKGDLGYTEYSHLDDVLITKDIDYCPDDPNKVDPGTCGCGVPDSDQDNDTVPDCLDQCPDEPDIDSDGDGILDCYDLCPDDPEKIDPGICGCGVPDSDQDNDTVPDCLDQCPGEPDIDSDGDGVLDCEDLCPDDPNKVDPGTCGCGIADSNSNNQGVTVTASDGSTDVAEAGATSDTYAIVLDTVPTADVTITVDPDNQTDIGAGPGVAVNLLFTGTNWNVPQTLTVTAIDDDVVEGPHISLITHTVFSHGCNYTDLAIDDVIVNIDDNDNLPPLESGPDNDTSSFRSIQLFTISYDSPGDTNTDPDAGPGLNVESPAGEMPGTPRAPCAPVGLFVLMSVGCLFYLILKD